MSEPDTNPLYDDARLRRPPPPCTIVIFGASGDLAHRKLLPAVYSMANKGLLPTAFTIVGVGRTVMTTEGYVATIKSSLGADGPGWDEFAASIRYVTAAVEEEAFVALERDLRDLEHERGTQRNRLYYLAVPPGAFPPLVQHMRAAGMTTAEQGFTRLVVEKPFGADVDSAQQLNQQIHQAFDESQVFRIDHYLGKETVQNILVLRFANGFFEPTWNRNYVDHVQITVAEDLGIGRRSGFYDDAGALRDIVQNHLLQLVCITAMEPPVRYDADSLRTEKLKVLSAIARLHPEEMTRDVVRGQYDAGAVGGDEVPGYRDEEGVPPNSSTETFVAWRLRIDNWRWAGTPFYIRTGKRLPRRVSEIAVVYRRPPHSPFAAPGAPPPERNMLVVRIQPEEGITLRFGAKVPVAGVRIRPVSMDFLYGASFGTESPDAYERLLLDAMRGDATLFPRYDEVEEAWQVVAPVLDWFAAEAPSFPNYAAGTWGPDEAHALLEDDGRRWRRS